MPYVLQWAGTVPAGQKFTQAVSSLDIVPTALAAAGAEGTLNPKLDGVNLLPYLTGEREGRPHESLVWRSGPNAAVRAGPWKLLVSESGIERLYDVEQDPSETRDLASKHPEQVERLKKIFKKWSTDKVESRQGTRKVRTRYNGDRIEWHI